MPVHLIENQALRVVHPFAAGDSVPCCAHVSAPQRSSNGYCRRPPVSRRHPRPRSRASALAVGFCRNSAARGPGSSLWTLNYMDCRGRRRVPRTRGCAPNSRDGPRIRTSAIEPAGAAIRSSPRVRFAVAISAISRWSCSGIRERPQRRDVQRQNSRKPCRCHRTSGSGCTTERMRRHSISRASATSVMGWRRPGEVVCDSGRRLQSGPVLSARNIAEYNVQPSRQGMQDWMKCVE